MTSSIYVINIRHKQWRANGEFLGVTMNSFSLVLCSFQNFVHREKFPVCGNCHLLPRGGPPLGINNEKQEKNQKKNTLLPDLWSPGISLVLNDKCKFQSDIHTNKE